MSNSNFDDRIKAIQEELKQYTERIIYQSQEKLLEQKY